ncbi:hypothetical protein RFI_12827, partial [Reticulomyxa filosa]
KDKDKDNDKKILKKLEAFKTIQQGYELNNGIDCIAKLYQQLKASVDLNEHHLNNNNNNNNNNNSSKSLVPDARKQSHSERKAQEFPSPQEEHKQNKEEDRNHHHLKNAQIPNRSNHEIHGNKPPVNAGVPFQYPYQKSRQAAEVNYDPLHDEMEEDDIVDGGSGDPRHDAFVQWLKEDCNLSQYLDTFKNSEMADISLLNAIISADELEDIGIESKFHRRRIWDQIKDLQGLMAETLYKVNFTRKGIVTLKSLHQLYLRYAKDLSALQKNLGIFSDAHWDIICQRLAQYSNSLMQLQQDAGDNEENELEEADSMAILLAIEESQRLLLPQQQVAKSSGGGSGE